MSEQQYALSTGGVFGDSDSFELAQRAGKLLSSSDLVPDAFKGKPANCVLALELAHRLAISPLVVLQNLHVIHGKPSWSASFLIGMVNASGRFSSLEFEYAGTGETRSCFAYAKSVTTGKVVNGPVVDMAMAKAEGWSTKAGSKWRTMPDLMLSYRSAAFFCRLYAPDIALGLRTSDEAIDVDASPTTPAPTKRAKAPTAEQEVESAPKTNPLRNKAQVVDADEIDVTPVADAKPAPAKAPPGPSPAAQAAMDAAPATEPEPAPEPADDSKQTVIAYIEGVEVKESRPDAARQWKGWIVEYSQKGQPIAKAGTYSTRLGAIIDDLEDGDRVKMTTHVGAKGNMLIDSIVPAPEKTETTDLPL